MTKPSPIEDSFDAFWEEQTGGLRTTVINGVEVAVPNDLPQGFAQRFDRLKDSDKAEDAAELVAMLYGDEAAKKWMEPPQIGTRKLMTALLWGMAQASGEDITFAEAYQRLQDHLTGKAKTPPNRAARRTAQRKPSGATGGR
ncbi:hypothetical protein [Streptomyces xantholiticus]|uniref:hypothetical protein n=1 Tax=Streptomyces xantholiticus TaxID=68285 RepID=UPI0016733149|nr:hypothetical protein [Streptomyces xantholiticus]GGW41372.1 hypothetical protein GCM10010381_27800 [Streptomyces xantholiticus]